MNFLKKSMNTAKRVAALITLIVIILACIPFVAAGAAFCLAKKAFIEGGEDVMEGIVSKLVEAARL